MLEVQDLWKSYEGKPLLCGVSFTVEPGETVCLLGPSGSGKSTILRIVAGLEEAEAGQIKWDGQDVSAVPVHRRNFGLMFQDYALFPHRSVAENIGFGLRMQHLPGQKVQARVHEALARVNLLGFERRRVTDLSGGEQQRVALARALAPNPKLLMLDEPLGALDRTLREQLEEELRQILHASGIPAIYVTHDQEEAFALADRLVLLHEGQVVQAGTPAEVYGRPVSAWVARFFGLGNLVEGRLSSLDPMIVDTPWGAFQPECPHGGHPLGARLQLLLRPGSAGQAFFEAESRPVNTLSGRVTDVVFRGEGYRVNLDSEGADLRFHLKEGSVRIDEMIQLALAQDGVLCLGQAEQEQGKD